MPMYFLILIKHVIELATNKIEFNLLALTVLLSVIIVIGLGVVGLFLEMKNNKKQTCEVFVVSKQNITDEHFFRLFLIVCFVLNFL